MLRLTEQDDIISYEGALKIDLALDAGMVCTGPTYGCHVIALPLPANHHHHAWLLGRQQVHTFWRRWLAGQRGRWWREGVPGQIPVLKASQPAPFAIFGGKVEAAIANHLHDHAIEGIAFFVPSWHIVLTRATWDTLYGRRSQALAKSLVGLCLLDVFLCPEVAISQQIHL